MVLSFSIYLAHELMIQLVSQYCYSRIFIFADIFLQD